MSDIMASSEPAVSVVMPTYNHGRFIKSAIGSVLGQTYRNLELIIVDNYSSDDTERIVKSYAADDSRVGYQKFKNNGVIAASRNVGIRLAKGQFVAFIDSDDCWFPQKLERVMECFSKRSEIDIVCHDENRISGEDGVFSKILRYGPYKSYEELLFKGNSLSTSAVVVRKNKLMESGLFSEKKEFVTAEDYEMWLRLSRTCNIEYLHDVLGSWRVHEASLSGVGNLDRHSASVLRVIEHHFAQWPDKTRRYMSLVDKRRGVVFRSTGWTLLRAGNMSLARGYLFKSLKASPLSAKSWLLFCVSLTGAKKCVKMLEKFT
jgi:glycosyltransferase involved in cell wall biosynthesis